jgi:FixJ family two-component response regulator
MTGRLALPRKSNPIATVVVVDDDLSVRRALQTQLRILGFRVLLFGSAEALLASNLPEGEVCILLDIYLPGIDGVELSQKLALSGRSRPTILMTGAEDSRTRMRIRESKPFRLLFKPFYERELLRVINAALKGSPAADC